MYSIVHRINACQSYPAISYGSAYVVIYMVCTNLYSLFEYVTQLISLASFAQHQHAVNPKHKCKPRDHTYTVCHYICKSM